MSKLQQCMPCVRLVVYRSKTFQSKPLMNDLSPACQVVLTTQPDLFRPAHPHVSLHHIVLLLRVLLNLPVGSAPFIAAPHRFPRQVRVLLQL